MGLGEPACPGGSGKASLSAGKSFGMERTMEWRRHSCMMPAEEARPSAGRDKAPRELPQPPPASSQGTRVMSQAVLSSHTGEERSNPGCHREAASGDGSAGAFGQRGAAESKPRRRRNVGPQAAPASARRDAPVTGTAGSITLAPSQAAGGMQPQKSPPTGAMRGGGVPAPPGDAGLRMPAGFTSHWA